MLGLDFGFRKSKDSSRKLKTPDVCHYPPSSQEELLASILEYLTSSYFRCPVSMSLFMKDYARINNNFKRASAIVNDLDFEKVWSFLEEKQAVELKEMAVGRKMDRMIMRVDMNVLLMLAREYFTLRPKQMPNINAQNFADKDFIEFHKKIDQSALDRKRIIQIMSEPTAIKKELQKTFEETQRQKILKSQAHLKSDMILEALSSDVCKYETRENCYKETGKKYCSLKHYYKLLQPHTKEGLGLCNKEVFTDLCRINKCQYIHYTLEDNNVIPLLKQIYTTLEAKKTFETADLPSQWINCDLRHFDLSTLGKYDAIMLDPPWDIHMNLPYGTLKDKEMKALKIRQLQDHGVCFLWVTGRALELGRECLTEWGYRRVEELVWIKTNQSGKIVRSGRTGHWLNHSKEHCLIGVKGDTSKLNRNIDSDVILGEVRETSRKPDEVYDIIERMAPGGRKLEVFARPHNRRKGWMSLGNQLPGIYIVEPDVIRSFKKSYPEVPLDEIMEKYKNLDVEDKDFINTVYFNHLFKTNN